MKLMNVILGYCGLPTKSAEMEIEKRSMRDLDGEYLNLYHEKM